MIRWVLLSLLWPLWASALPPDTWLVVIGNNRGEPDEADLLYAERDATEVARVFRRLGGVPPNRIIEVLGEDATVARQAIVEVRERAAQQPSSALVVYYSGHADAASLHLGGTRLPVDELDGLISQSRSALRMLIVDACRSGAVSRVKGLRDAGDFEVQIRATPQVEGTVIITSSTAGETSQESDALRGSFFSHHLINGLRGAADRNGDDRVTLAEAYAYTYAQTLRSSGRTLHLQHPTYRFDLKGQGEVVLARLKRDRRMARLRLAEPMRYVITDSAGTVSEVEPVRANALIALAARRYRVQARLPDEYREFSVRLTAGQTTRLAEQPFERVQYDRLVRARGGALGVSQGVSVLGGARGGLVPGDGVTPVAVLGYTADLPWFSVGTRVRLGRGDVSNGEPASVRRHEEYAFGLTLERFTDLPAVSVAFGVLVEGAWHRQVFTGARDIQPRSALAAGFGVLLAAERHLLGGLSIRLEGGPLAAIFESATVNDGFEVGQQLTTPVTWSAALGLKWRL